MRIILSLFIVTIALAASAQNTLTYPPGTVDDLVVIDGAQNLMRGARADNVRASADGSFVELVDGALAGSLTIPMISGKFQWNEAIPSWNGWTAKNTGFRVWMNPVLANRAQSAWFDAGTWGRVSDELTTRIIPLHHGIYNIDTLQLNTLAEGVAVRFDLVRMSADLPSPKIFMFCLAYTNSTGNQQLARKFANPKAQQLGGASLQIPYKSQVVSRENWIGRICSPASVNMAMAQFGIQQETQTVAADLYDPVCDAFGVWHRSIQGASQEGLRGYITRFRNWNDVTKEIAQGHVVCASIRFKAREVDDPMVRHNRRKNGTEGHLVLITGVRADGTVTVHDTASKDYGVNSVWRQEELAKAWFDKGGVAYVFTGRR